jgi:hypothetical protein
VPPSRAMSVHTTGNAQTDSVPPSRDMLSVHNTGNVHPETFPPQGEERICCYRKEKEPTEKGTRRNVKRRGWLCGNWRAEHNRMCIDVTCAGEGRNAVFEC